jgi:hypothetical protein
MNKHGEHLQAGTRVAVVGGEHAGRTGVVVDPMPLLRPAVPPHLLSQMPNAGLWTGMLGHEVVLLDAESGQANGAGGRGGRRVLIEHAHLQVPRCHAAPTEAALPPIPEPGFYWARLGLVQIVGEAVDRSDYFGDIVVVEWGTKMDPPS